MDLLALTMFTLVTLLFAFFIAAVLKFFIFRFVPIWGFGTMPYIGWVIIVVVIAFALQFAGVNVAYWYSQFFAWLSKELNGGLSLEVMV